MICRVSIVGRMLIAVVAIHTFCGCGDSGPQTVPVRGRITYGEGQWPTTGTLYFTPVGSPGQIMRPGIAKFSQDGSFAAQTFAEGDGLLPGQYAIRVECWEHPPVQAPGAPAPKSYVPREIRTGKAPGWNIEVQAGQALDLTLDVPKS